MWDKRGRYLIFNNVIWSLVMTSFIEKLSFLRNVVAHQDLFSPSLFLHMDQDPIKTTGWVSVSIYLGFCHSMVNCCSFVLIINVSSAENI